MFRLVIWWTFDDSEMLTASIIRAMVGTVSTSETLVNFYQTTRRSIPEDSHRLLIYLVCDPAT
jgi:hypothetical protein